LDNSVATALSKHDVNFNFSYEGKEWNFATYEPFKGNTEKLSFTQECDILTGEATTLYYA
jgi:hypothetical protein